MRGNLTRALFLAAAAAVAAPAHAQGFFGPRTAGSLQPELDAYVRLSDGVRLQGQVQPYLVPEQGYAQVTWAAYASWLVADVLRDLLHPDLAKSHAIDVRAGVLFTQTVAQGSGPPGDVWTLQLDATPKVTASQPRGARSRSRRAARQASQAARGSSARPGIGPPSPVPAAAMGESYAARRPEPRRGRRPRSRWTG